MARELETLLSQWSERRGLQPAALGEDGRHYYVFDGDYEIALSQTGPKVYMESELAPIPAQRDQAEDLLERVMKLQLARARASEAVLALAPDGNGLVLFQIVPAGGLDLRRFEAALSAFVNTVAFWANKLGESAQRPAAPPVLQIMYP